MRDGTAISLGGISKVYKLYPSRVTLALDALGLYCLRPGGPPPFPQRWALREIELKVGRGERVGIIGRNGAGKTTLLRLVSGIAAPTAGRLSIHGQVQALLDMGLGFHPDFTGLENIKASLLFNGLDEAQTAQAVADVSAFAELGEYLDQPLKTYSLGMRARLGFATATAIRPDILIIDEVLGAGDAYFLSKCSARIHNLTSGGTTLLLVSHSNQQIVQFCDRAIWLEEGRVAEDGEVLEVVKAYDAFIRNLEEQRLRGENARASERADRLQERSACAPDTSGALDGRTANELVRRAISRWPGVPGLKIRALHLLDAAGRESPVVNSGAPAALAVDARAESGGDFPCIVAFNVYTLDGRLVLLHCSEPRTFRLAPAQTIRARLHYPRLLLGNGDYVASVGLYRKLDLANPGSAEFYDLWDRSYQFRVYTDQPADSSLLQPPCSWSFE